jgi:hypothetical protein
MDDVLACRRPVLLISVRGITLACLVIACVACAGSTRADSIGVHFGGANSPSSDNSFLAPNDAAGYVAQQNWNNTEVDVSTPGAAIASGSGSLSPLLDSQGSPTTVSLTYSSGGVAFATGDPTGTPDERLMHSYLDAKFANAIVTLTDIPYATYDLYAYVGWNVQNGPQQGNAFTDVSFDTADFTTFAMPFSSTGYVVAPVPGGFTYPGGNVLHFSGLSGSTLNYFQTGAGLNGLQIVDTSQIAAPLPSAAFLGIPLLAGLGLVHFRAYSLSTENSRFSAR